MAPRITMILGDRNGIGPELAARLLSEAETHAAADVEVLGDPAVLDEGAAAAGLTLDPAHASTIPFIPVDGLTTTPGRATAGAGEEMLALLAKGAQRVVSGDSDGLLFAPLNKEAMHLGGLDQEDEMRFLANVLGFDGTVGELNVLPGLRTPGETGLWTTRVTSHVPLKDVAAEITQDGVFDGISFAHRTLRAAGVDRPRVGVAALNPHAGDGGNFGMEEIEVITPAIDRARKEQIAAEGPYPSDTVFVRARNGDFDVVVTMYHDQGQIAMKLLGFAEGVTVLGGLPVPVTTCGHGTGYDIVGQGIAKPDSMRNAFKICVAMARSAVQGAV